MVKIIIKAKKQLVELLEELMPLLQKLLEEVGFGYVQQFVKNVIDKLSHAYDVISNWSWNDLLGYVDGTFETFINNVSSVYETLTAFIIKFDWSGLAGDLWNSISLILDIILQIILGFLGFC